MVSNPSFSAAAKYRNKKCQKNKPSNNTWAIIILTIRLTQLPINPGQVNQKLALAYLAGIKIKHVHLCWVAGNTV